VPPESRPADVTTPVLHGAITTTATEVPGEPAEAKAKEEKKQKRKKRRRRIGVATVVTLLGLLIVAAVAVGGIVYYGRSGYFIAFSPDGNIAVFQGRPEGVLWVEPTMEVVYPLTREELAEEWQERIDRTIALTSLDAADRWFQALASNPNAVPGLVPTTTVAPTTAATTTTTVPGASTTGVGP
jgi:protein phosphatase